MIPGVFRSKVLFSTHYPIPIGDKSNITPGITFLLHGTGTEGQIEHKDESFFSAEIINHADVFVTQGEAFFEQSLFFFSPVTFLEISSQPKLLLGEQFSIEFRLYISDFPVKNWTVFSYGAGGLEVNILDTGAVTVSVSGQPALITSTILISELTWVHIAVVRNKNDLMLFIDSKIDSTVVLSSVNFISDSFDMGAVDGVPNLIGYISEFLIFNKLVRYVGDFTNTDKEFEAKIHVDRVKLLRGNLLTYSNFTILRETSLLQENLKLPTGEVNSFKHEFFPLLLMTIEETLKLPTGEILTYKHEFFPLLETILPTEEIKIHTGIVLQYNHV